MMFWVNLLGYQLVWFINVSSVAHGNPWLGVLASVTFVISQMLLSEHPTVDMRLLAVAVLLGSAVDGVLAASGSARYAAPSPALPPGGAPLWILGVWASFALTLNRSLGFLRARPLLALLMGAVGGPLAYLGAARGWQALAFHEPAWRGLLLLALGWAVALPLLTVLAHGWTVAARLGRAGGRA
jgi:hypothetical protein